MNERDILDAPESKDDTLKIPIRSAILTGLGICCSIFFITRFEKYLKIVLGKRFDFWIFKYEPAVLALLILISLCFYFFLTSIRYSQRHWFRIMTVSITIFFVSVTAMISLFQSNFLVDFTYTFLKRLSFISLVLGGGCSMANMFLIRKKYLIFSVIIIFTFLLLLLTEYI